MADLIFLEDTHEYFYNGEKMPSVTQVLKPLFDFSCVGDEVLEVARQRGQIVHKLCELDDRDDLDPDSVDPALQPYLDAWRNFRRDTHFTPRRIEHRLINPQYRYAGTEDREGTLSDTLKHMVDLIDIKTSALLGPEVGPQLAGYENARAADEPPIYRRLAVQLKKNGKYHIELYPDRSDFAVFLSCLQIHNWRIKHGKRHHSFAIGNAAR